MEPRSIRISVLEARQPVGTFYVGSIQAYDLLAISSFDYRRPDGNTFIGIQRQTDPKRVRDISKYINTIDATFPTSIVISIDENCASIVEDHGTCKVLEIKEYLDQVQELSVSFDRIARIIDGQHRLKAFEMTQGLQFDLSVTIFIGIDEGTEAEIFSTVNLAQTKVNKSLVYDLFSFSKFRSPEKTCHEIAVALDTMDGSPFKNRIKRLGVATDGRFGETLSQATIVKGILPYISADPLTDRDIGKRYGFWDSNLSDPKKRLFRPFFERQEDSKILRVLLNYFGAIRDRWPDAWEDKSRGAMIARTNGYNAFMRFLPIAYLRLAREPKEIASKNDFATIFDRVRLSDADFKVENFVPGTSGSSNLFKILRDETSVADLLDGL